MRKSILPLAAVAAVASPVAAQESSVEQPLAEMADRMSDSQHQREMALMLQTMTEVLLDIPIAPLAQAAADMAGEEAAEVNPDLTLRKMAPGAGRVSEEIGRNAPRAMEAMAGMAKGFAAMAPALEEMAERMRDAMPRED